MATSDLDSVLPGLRAKRVSPSYKKMSCQSPIIIVKRILIGVNLQPTRKFNSSVEHIADDLFAILERSIMMVEVEKALERKVAISKSNNKGILL